MPRRTDGQNGRMNGSNAGSHERKQRYRDILEDLSNLEDESNNERMEKTQIAVQEAKEILSQCSIEERVRHPGEGYLDSRVLRATSDLAVRSAEAISGNINVYDKHELAQHIKENPEWWLFGFPREAPAVSYLFGTFAAAPQPPRPRPARARAERQRLAELSAPDCVDRLEKTDEGTDAGKRIYKQLRRLYRARGAPLSYFHCVLHPHSFGRSVESVYHVAFLVREGLLDVSLDEEYELPFITPLSAAQTPVDLAEEKQFIVSLDMQRWQELIEVFNITEALLS